MGKLVEKRKKEQLADLARAEKASRALRDRQQQETVSREIEGLRQALEQLAQERNQVGDRAVRLSEDVAERTREVERLTGVTQAQQRKAEELEGVFREAYEGLTQQLEQERDRSQRTRDAMLDREDRAKSERDKAVLETKRLVEAGREKASRMRDKASQSDPKNPKPLRSAEAQTERMGFSLGLRPGGVARSTNTSPPRRSVADAATSPLDRKRPESSVVPVPPSGPLRRSKSAAPASERAKTPAPSSARSATPIPSSAFSSARSVLPSPASATKEGSPVVPRKALAAPTPPRPVAREGPAEPVVVRSPGGDNLTARNRAVWEQRPGRNFLAPLQALAARYQVRVSGFNGAEIVRALSAAGVVIPETIWRGDPALANVSGINLGQPGGAVRQRNPPKGRGKKKMTDYSGPMDIEEPKTPRARRPRSAPTPRVKGGRLPKESYEGFNDEGNDLFDMPAPMQSKTELMQTENAHMPILTGNKGLPKIYGMEKKLKMAGFYKPQIHKPLGYF
jgi:hypothetical protein